MGVSDDGRGWVGVSGEGRGWVGVSGEGVRDSRTFIVGGWVLGWRVLRAAWLGPEILRHILAISGI